MRKFSILHADRKTKKTVVSKVGLHACRAQLENKELNRKLLENQLMPEMAPEITFCDINVKRAFMGGTADTDGSLLINYSNDERWSLSISLISF